MRYPFRAFAPLLALTVSLVQLAATPLPEGITAGVAAANLLVHGRLPAASRAGTVRDGTTSASPEVGVVFDRLREELTRDAGGREEAAKAAYFDAFGRVAGEEDIRESSRVAVTYNEHVQHHLAQLAQFPEAYDDVIHRAYRFVVRREAYSEELAYWKKYDTLSYALLVGCIEHWARRNQPGLMVTTGRAIVPLNSEFLITVQLEPSVASDLRVAAGLGDATGPYFNDAADARNILAPGAARLVAEGGTHFVAVGGARLAAFGPVEMSEGDR